MTKLERAVIRAAMHCSLVRYPPKPLCDCNMCELRKAVRALRAAQAKRKGKR